MIGGMTEHDGAPALAFHWLKVADNEQVEIRTHGLFADHAIDGLAELCLMAADSRTKKPLLHAWASPSIEYDEDGWQAYWTRFEDEMGLSGQPYVEAQHLKYGHGGRWARHIHRAYLRVTPAGKTVPMRHLAPRQEKLSRIAEFATGEPFTSGVYNRAVISALTDDGYGPVAQAMVQAGLDLRQATRAVTASERSATERLDDLAIDEVEARLWRAWVGSGDGISFETALAGAGLRLAIGEKTLILVTPGGNAVPLRRSLNKMAKRHGFPSIRKADVDRRVEGLNIVSSDGISPLPGFFAGRFGITGSSIRDERKHLLEKTQGPVVEQPCCTPDARNLQMGTAAASERQPKPIDINSLSADQIEAIERYREKFFDAAQTTKSVSEPLATQNAQSISDAEAWHHRRKIEIDLYQQPSLQELTWRDRYKSELANLPPEVGRCLAWVDRLEADRVRVLLKNSGTMVMTEPGRATASAPTLDTITVIVAHAKARSWKAALVSGGTAQWRNELARAATRAGLRVANGDLQEIVKSETGRMIARELAVIWRQRRSEAEIDRSQVKMNRLFETIQAMAGVQELEHALDGPDITLYKRDMQMLAAIRNSQIPHGSPSADIFPVDGGG